MSLCFFYCRAGYKIIKKIGEGTFSEVVKTQSLKDGKFYACKTMKQTINRYVICNQILSLCTGNQWCIFTILVLCLDP